MVLAEKAGADEAERRVKPPRLNSDLWGGDSWELNGGGEKKRESSIRSEEERQKGWKSPIWVAKREVKRGEKDQPREGSVRKLESYG